MAHPLYFALMVVAGVAVATQAPINSGLGAHIGRLPAAMVSFCSGALLAVFLVALLTAFAPQFLSPAPREAVARARSLPWWLYAGGPLGLMFVTAATVAIPRIGVANATVAVLSGQLCFALIIDALGLLGVAAQGFEAKKLLAIPLMLGAAWLVQTK